MPPDPARIAETRAWLHKASEDLRAGLHQLSAEPPFCSDASFHAQQVCEKAAKGFLTWHDRPFGKTHNLVELGRACVAISPDLEPVLRRAAPLTEYAWRFRYPGDPEEPAIDEVKLALVTAREVLEAILARLPSEVHP
jgi:HEPN domain-containing protein